MGKFPVDSGRLRNLKMQDATFCSAIGELNHKMGQVGNFACLCRDAGDFRMGWLRY